MPKIRPSRYHYVIAAILAITVVVVVVVGFRQPAHANSPAGDTCNLGQASNGQYGTQVTSWDGNGATQWNQAGYHYQTYVFTVHGQAALGLPGFTAAPIPPGTPVWVVTQGGSCGASDTVDTTNPLYEFNGIRATDARLGFPPTGGGAAISNGDGGSATFAAPGSVALAANDSNAAEVDDAGRAEINDGTVWCANYDGKDGSTNGSGLGYANCPGEITTQAGYTYHGAGYLFTADNDPAGASSTWYTGPGLLGANTDLFCLINFDTTGCAAAPNSAPLNPFALHMQVENTWSGGFQAQTYITFAYPTTYQLTTALTGSSPCTSSSVPPGSISAVAGTFSSNSAKPLNSLVVSPQTAGDLMVLTAMWPSASAGSTHISSVSGGGVTWSPSPVVDYYGFEASDEEIWYGKVINPGASQTITITWAGAGQSFQQEYSAQEFTAGLGSGTSWSVDKSDHHDNASSTTITYPSLSPTTAGELYFGYSLNDNNASAGSNPGFAYASTAQHNEDTRDTNTSPPGTYTPTASQAAGMSTTIAALFVANAPSSVQQVVPGGTYNLTALLGNSGNVPSPNSTAVQISLINGCNGTTSTLTNAGDISQIVSGNPIPWPNPTFNNVGPIQANHPSPNIDVGATVQFKVSASAGDGDLLCFASFASPSNPTTPGAVESSPNQCFQVAQYSYPYFTTSGGDVHVGGGVGSGTCNNGLNGSLTGQAFGAPSISQYIASASGLISNFGSGNISGGTALTLGNSGGNGFYNSICRPNLRLAAENFKAANPAASSINEGTVTTLNTANLTGVNKLYYVNPSGTGSGTVTLSGAANWNQHNTNPTDDGLKGGGVTLLVYGNVVINGNITFFTESAAQANGANRYECTQVASGAGSYTDMSQSVCPSLAVIATGGIYFCDGSGARPNAPAWVGGNCSGAVTSAYGFYSAGNVSPFSNSGDIYTGYGTDALTVTGALQGYDIDFGRYCTNAGGTTCLRESVNASPFLYLSPPPGLGSAYSSPIYGGAYGGELPPIYN